MLTADMKSRIAEALAHVASIIADRRSAHYTSPFDFAFTCETAEELAGFVTALLAHIQAQSEQLRQVQAEGAALRTDLHQALRQWNMYAAEVRHAEEDPLAEASDPEAQMYQAIVTRLTSTFAFTAYAARVARMEEALERAGRYAAQRTEQGDELAADLVRSIAGALAGEGEKR